MEHSCANCDNQFSLSEQETEFYQKIQVNTPKLCPDCRLQRRIIWRNERSLYKRKCDLCKKETVSFYSEDKPYLQYCPACWWSDKWDPPSMDYNESRPFLEQWQELLQKTPHLSLLISHCENSDYCPYSVYYKNSYMCVSGSESEDCYYCYHTVKSRNCMDCSIISGSDLCYECTNCSNLYSSIFCHECENSSDLAFCTNCTGCQNCIGCFGLRHKEYYIFNKPATKVEYEKSLKEIEANYLSLLDTLKKHSRHCEKYPHEATHVINCENSTGDYLFNCRNTISSFNCRDLEDCGYCMQMPPRSNNAYDMLYCWGELLYNSISAVNGNKNVCCIFCWDSPDSDYSFECFYSQNLLGCVGLKHSEYKILNKKYSPEEHEKLRTKIIDKMKENGSYGEFFPMQYSPFCYNETIAHDYFPMKKDEVIGKGLQWQENFTYTVGKETKKKIPTEISDDLTKEIFACEKCRRNYKFVKQELDIYKKSGLPLPIFCPECRNTARAQRRPPQKLWARNCAKCGNPMQTSFSPNRPEIVYCKDCYLKEIY